MQFKTVLITGADGFIGSHLTELLLKKGYSVRALSMYNSFGHCGWLDEIPLQKKLEVVSGDIRDPHFVKQITDGVDAVIHLAALIAIPYSYHAPDSYIDTNIKGVLNLCQAAKDRGNLRVIHTSTSEVYGTALYIPIDENHPKQPQSPYSASKIGADALCLSFHYSYGLPVTVVRPFNTFGPRQSARAVIPTIITQIASGVKSIKLGNINTTRDFNYVRNVAEGFIAILESDSAIGQEINIASSEEISIEELFYMIRGIMKGDAEILVEDVRIRPADSEVYRLLGDNKKIKDLTNWTPSFSFNEGIQKTIEWFSRNENLVKYKPNIYNI